MSYTMPDYFARLPIALDPELPESAVPYRRCLLCGSVFADWLTPEDYDQPSRYLGCDDRCMDLLGDILDPHTSAVRMYRLYLSALTSPSYDQSENHRAHYYRDQATRTTVLHILTREHLTGQWWTR